MTPAQKRRLNENIIEFFTRRLGNWLFPAKTVGIPPIPGKVAKDGLTMATIMPLKFKDRLRAVFCSEIQIVVMVSCEKSPGDSVANINFNLLPPFAGSMQEKKTHKQPELPINKP